MVNYENMLEKAKITMGGTILPKKGRKKASKASKSRRQELERLADEVAKVRMQEELAIRSDIARRYGGYDSDVSVGGMYQMKATKKRRCKRKKKAIKVPVSFHDTRV